MVIASGQFKSLFRQLFFSSLFLRICKKNIFSKSNDQVISQQQNIFGTIRDRLIIAEQCFHVYGQNIFFYICKVHFRSRSQFAFVINRKDSHPPGPFAMTLLNSYFIHKNFPNRIKTSVCCSQQSRIFFKKYTGKLQ